jgi:hypothetical protein
VRALSVFMRLQDREALEETWRVVGEVYKDIPTPSLAGIIVVRDFLAHRAGCDKTRRGKTYRQPVHGSLEEGAG